GGMFLADWTFGRIWFVKLTPNGGTYAGKAEPFLQSSGDLGLAPTALAVHPLTGDLYVSIGGRGTRGAVYRVSYPAGGRTGFVTPPLLPQVNAFAARQRLDKVVRSRQPLSQENLSECMSALTSRDRTTRQTAYRCGLRLPDSFLRNLSTSPSAAG